MCFIAKNRDYVYDLSETLKECHDNEMRLWVLAEERKNILERLHSSFFDCISPSFFFESTLKMVGEDPIIQNCLVYNIYLDENCDKIFPKLIRSTDLLPFKINNSLYPSLKKYKSAKDVLNLYLLLELKAKQDDIVDIIENRNRKNLAVFKLLIDNAVLLMRERQEEKLELLLIHFIKAWNIFMSYSPESYNQCALVILDRMVGGIKKESLFEHYDISNKLRALESIIFTINHSGFPFFTDVSFNQPSTKIEEEIVGLRNVIMNLAKLTNSTMTLSELIVNYRIEIQGSKMNLFSENWYYKKIIEELRKYDKQSVIEQLGLTSIKEGYKLGDMISRLIVQKKYIYEVLT